MKSIGAVLSIFWILGVGFAAWLEVTEDPLNLGWLVHFVAVRPRQDPNIVGLEGFGLFFQVVDPARLFIVMLVPVIVGWLLVSLSNRLFGRR